MAQRNASLRTPLGTVNAIFATHKRTGSYPSRVMSVARPPIEDSNSEPKKARVEFRLALSFLDKVKIGTI